MKRNKSNIIYIFYFMYILIIFTITRFDFVNSNLMMLAWICNVSYVIYVAFTIKLNGEWLNGNVIFMTFIFFFCFGQIFLYSIGVDTCESLVFVSNTKSEIIRASKYFLYSYLLFGLGLNFTVIKYDYKCKIDSKYNIAIKKVAYFIAITSGAVYFYLMIPKIFLAIRSGYGSLYEENNISNLNLLGYYSSFFIPSLLLLFYAYKDNKKAIKIIISILIFISICLLIIGGRGTAISIFVIVLFIYGKYIRKYGKKDIIVLFFIFIFISILIPFIANYRSNRDEGALSSLNKVLDNDDNPIIQTVNELGGTMNAWCLTDKAIPSLQNYGYGSSYISSVGMLIPSFMLGGLSFANYAALDIWLQNIWDMSYGPGFNIFAETYYNFGWHIGILFSFILGYVFGKFFNIKSKNKEKNGLLSILSVIFLYNVLLIPRLPFHNTLRNFFFMHVLIFLIINMVYKKDKENE